MKRRAGGMAAVLLLGAAFRVMAASSAVRLDVPFFPDKTDQCGPSTLASLLSFWGKPTDPQTLRQEMYVAKLKGTLPMDLIQAAKTRGLPVTMVAGNRDQLRGELDAGRPVLAMLDVGYALVPVGHYVVVTGYDENNFYVHSGGKAHRPWPYKKFEKQWELADHWALLTQKP